MKIKNNYQNNLLSTSEENNVQIDKLKKIILENQKKVNNLDKIISEKEEIISKLEYQLENVGHLKEKSQQKVT